MMKLLKKFIVIELGTCLFAIAVGMFLLPGDILTGGVAGIATLLYTFVPIEKDILVIIISLLLFAIGAIFLGKQFVITTAIHSISYPVMLLIVTRVIKAQPIDPLLGAIYGGIIGGIGCGLIFKEGGSTGGTDVPPLIAHKYFKTKVSTGIMICDAATVLLGLFLYGLNDVLIGLISVYLTTFALEKTSDFYGGIIAKKVEIISDKYEAISQEIHTKLERGTTYIESVGGYSKNKNKILMVIVDEDQYDDLKEIIERNDPNAFIIVTETKDVNGEGFTFATRL